MTTTDPATVPSTAPQPTAPGEALAEHVVRHSEPVADCDWCPLPENLDAAPQPAPLDLDAIEARAEKAHDHIAKLCSGEERWTMRVPAQLERDSDLVIGTALNDVDRLVAEVRRLRAELWEGFRRERAILHWAADRLDHTMGPFADGKLLRRWAAELDAAPAAPRTYALPAEPPPEVTDLWDHEGVRWRRVEPQPPYGADWAPWELLVDKPPQVSVEATDWAELVYAAGPLSTVPPAGTEGDQ